MKLFEKGFLVVIYIAIVLASTLGIIAIVMNILKVSGVYAISGNWRELAYVVVLLIGAGVILGGNIFLLPVIFKPWLGTKSPLERKG